MSNRIERLIIDKYFFIQYKRKSLDIFQNILTSSDYYKRSYVHRDVLTHIIVTITDFLIAVSQDEHIKFWKIITPEYIKQQQTAAQYILTKNNDDKDENTNSLINGPIEFVKH